MNKLSTDEKQIRLAKAEGWEPYSAENVGAAARLFNGDRWFRHAESSTIATPKELPDYFGDLNACHTVEKLLCGTNTRTNGVSDYTHYRLSIDKCATAAQRAEALGLTLGLWKEGE